MKIVPKEMTSNKKVFRSELITQTQSNIGYEIQQKRICRKWSVKKLKIFHTPFYFVFN